MTFKSQYPGLSRRSLIERGLAGAVGIASLATSSCTSFSTNSPSPSAAPSYIRPEIFDLHTHFHFQGKIDDPLWAGRTEAARNARLSGGFFSIVPDMPAIGMTRTGPAPKRNLEPGEAWNEYKRQLSQLRNLAKDSSIRLVTDPRALETAADDEISGYISCEGCHMLEGRIERLEEIYRDGVRSIQLVHYVPNDIGDHQTGDPRFGGLSEFGKRVVVEANRLGMVIDVAHATFATTRDAAELGTRSVIASHTVLDGDGIPDGLKIRAIDRDHARLIAEIGGVVGAWPVTRSMEQYLAARAGKPVEMTAVHRDVLDLVELLGPDHVGLGTDFAGGPIVISDYAQLEKWSAGLAAGGLRADELAMVCSGNAERILRDALG